MANLNRYRVTDRRFLEPVTVESPDTLDPGESGRLWIDIEVPDREELQDLLAPLNLQPFIMVHCLRIERGPCYAHYEKALFLEMPYGVAVDNVIHLNHISIICMDSLLITIHNKGDSCLTQLAMDFVAEEKRLQAPTLPALLYHILDELNDQSTRCGLIVVKGIDELGRELDKNPEEIEPEDTLSMNRQLHLIDSILWGQRFCVSYLQNTETKVFTIRGLVESYRALAHVLELACQRVDLMEQRLKDYSNYQTALSQDKLNTRLRVLTVFSAIFLPLTLISSIYGMNFRVMPELKWSYAYPALIGTMVIIMSAMIYFFWRRGWFK